MFIAMNQFRVKPDQCEAFERAWRERDSYLEGVDGFESFHLLKGPIDDDGAQLYSSHTVWRDRAAFRAWVESDAFKRAHAQGGSLKEVVLGPPRLYEWTEVEL